MCDLHNEIEREREMLNHLVCQARQSHRSIEDNELIISRSQTLDLLINKLNQSPHPDFLAKDNVKK